MTDITDQSHPIILKFVRQRLRPYADIFLGLEAALDTDAMYYQQVVEPNLNGTDVTPNVPSLGAGDEIIDANLVTAGRAQLDAQDARDIAVALGSVKAAIVAAKAVLVKASVNRRAFFSSPVE